MSFCFNNQLEITKEDPVQLGNLIKILNIEYGNCKDEGRSKITITKKDSSVLISIKSKDIVALRASLNGVIKVLYTFENITNLTRNNIRK